MLIKDAVQILIPAILSFIAIKWVSTTQIDHMILIEPGQSLLIFVFVFGLLLLTSLEPFIPLIRHDPVKTIQRWTT